MQQNISWWRTSLGEKELQKLTESFHAEKISGGTVTQVLENKFAEILDIPYAVATTNGTTALMLALIALDLKPGDEVIVPNRTFIATAHAALALGAKVVLVDVEKNRPVMDLGELERKITLKTKVIIPVHLNGRDSNMRELRAIANRHGVKVVEDAAQAYHSKNRDGFLGTQSNIGCFSLGMAKLVTTGQGGMMVTRDKALYEKLRLVRGQGVLDPLDGEYKILGINGKCTDLLSSIGIAQLDRTKEKLERVHQIYDRYCAALSNLSFIRILPVNLTDGEVPVWTEVLTHRRGELVAFLAERGVQTRKFLPDLHISPHLNNQGEFPNSRVFQDQGLILPCGPGQPLENVDRTIELIFEFGKRI